VDQFENTKPFLSVCGRLVGYHGFARLYDQVISSGFGAGIRGLSPADDKIIMGGRMITARIRSHIALMGMAMCLVSFGAQGFLYYHYTSNRPREQQPELGRVYQRYMKPTGATVYLSLADTTAPELLWMAFVLGMFFIATALEKKYAPNKKIELSWPERIGWQHWLFTLFFAGCYALFLYFEGGRITNFVADHGFGVAPYF
jgi:hypothetical protein